MVFAYTSCVEAPKIRHDTRALQHYLGHKNIQRTVRYIEMAPDRFKDFWRGAEVDGARENSDDTTGERSQVVRSRAR